MAPEKERTDSLPIGMMVGDIINYFIECLWFKSKISGSA